MDITVKGKKSNIYLDKGETWQTDYLLWDTIVHVGVAGIGGWVWHKKPGEYKAKNAKLLDTVWEGKQHICA